MKVSDFANNINLHLSLLSLLGVEPQDRIPSTEFVDTIKRSFRGLQLRSRRGSDSQASDGDLATLNKTGITWDFSQGTRSRLTRNKLTSQNEGTKLTHFSPYKSIT